MVCRCNAVHPGYGFLSESADFVDKCEEAGIAYLGPRADTMRLFSRKHDARAFAQNAKVPILAGMLQEWFVVSVTRFVVSVTCSIDHQTTHCCNLRRVLNSIFMPFTHEHVCSVRCTEL